MVEIISVFLNFWGTPVAGLTPVINIYEVSNAAPTTLVVTAANMTEVGGGTYVYKFTTRDTLKRYFATIDGGAGFWLDWLRYHFVDVSYNKNV